MNEFDQIVTKLNKLDTKSAILYDELTKKTEFESNRINSVIYNLEIDVKRTNELIKKINFNGAK